MVVPLNDVNALAAELAHHSRDAHAPLADQGADRVYVRVKRGERNLGAAPGLSRERLHFNRAGGELGRLHLKQLHDELRVRAGEAQVHAAESLVNRVEIRPDALAHAVAFAGNLFFIRDDAGRTAEVHEYRPTLHPLDDAGDNLAFLLAELVLWLKRKDDFFSDSDAALDELRIGEENMLLGVKAGQFSLGKMLLLAFMMPSWMSSLQLPISGIRLSVFQSKAHRRVVHDGLYLFKSDSAGVEVKLCVNDLSALAVFAFVGSCHRAFNGIHHGGTANAPVFKLSEHCIDGFEVYHMDCVCRPFYKESPEGAITYG